MNKFNYILFAALLALGLAACKPEVDPLPAEPEIDDPNVPSSMQLAIDGFGNITSDTTITVNNAVFNYMTEKMEMKLSGTLSGTHALRVIITRSTTGRMDEFCAMGSCVPGNEEAEQTIDFTSSEDTHQWYVHYALSADANDAYSVNYKFINYSRVINLTVVFDYQDAE